MNDDILLWGALAAGAYVLYNQVQQAQLQAQAIAEAEAQAQANANTILMTQVETTQPETELPPINASLQCPDGYLLIGDGTCCPGNRITEEGTCAACPIGTASALDPSGEAMCCELDFIVNGSCMPCPNGYTLSADGASCNLNDPTDTTNPLNIPSTGNQA